jgi:hypothetical protein
MTPKKFLVVAAAIAALAGILVGAAATYAALQHNPQQEFLDLETGNIHLDAIAPVFASLTTFFLEIAGYYLVFLVVRVTR